MRKIVACGRGYTHGTELFSKLTAFQTDTVANILRCRLGDTATHVFVWFQYSDGFTVYYEALHGKDWSGPYPLSKAVQWVDAKKGRKLRLYDLTEVLCMDSFEMEARQRTCEYKKEHWTYADPQLLLMIRPARLVRRILGRSMFKPSVARVICSEAASVILDNPPYYDHRRVCGVPDYDFIDPAMLERADIRMGGKKKMAIGYDVDMIDTILLGAYA